LLSQMFASSLGGSTESHPRSVAGVEAHARPLRPFRDRLPLRPFRDRYLVLRPGAGALRTRDADSLGDVEAVEPRCLDCLDHPR
jgi:hypothetical protein